MKEAEIHHCLRLYRKAVDSYGKLSDKLAAVRAATAGLPGLTPDPAALVGSGGRFEPDRRGDLRGAGADGGASGGEAEPGAGGLRQPAG